MFRHHLILILSLTFSFSLFSQSYIQGTVKDSSGVPVPVCSVLLLQAKDSIVLKKSLSDEKGEFIFQVIPNGSYILEVTHVGYASHFSEILKIDSISRLTVGPVIMSRSLSNLQEASVSADRPTIEFKNGVIILNTENNPLAAGNTVLELIKKLPGVLIDGQGNITVGGKSGVRFLIDGRLQQVPVSQLLTMFGSMSAESISSIELIRNPSAKYDAAGTAGLINIIPKKIKVKGFNMNISESDSYGQRFRTNSGTGLNYKSDKVTLFANVGYFDRHLLDNNIANRTLYGIGVPQYIDLSGQTGTSRWGVNFRGGLEYTPAAKTTIGFTVSGGPTTSLTNASSTTSVINDQYLNYNYLVSNTSNSEWFNSPSAVVYIIQKIGKKGAELSLSADYTNYTYNQTSSNANVFLDIHGIQIDSMLGYKNINALNFKIYTQKLDFSQKLTKSLNLEAGLKSSFVNNSSNALLESNNAAGNKYFVDSTFSSIYDYKEKIFSGYITLNKTIGKMSIQAGVRAEQTDIKAVNKYNSFLLNDNYFNLFPNAAITYKLNAKNSLQLTYGYRIDRPNYDQLNPVYVFNSELNYSTGNPQLKPQYSHNITFDYNYNNFIINSLNYTHISNSIYNFSYTDSAQVLIDTVFNFASRNILSYTLMIQKQIRKWYNMQFSGLLAYSNYRGSVNNYNGNSSSLIFFTTLNNEFYLPGNYKLQFTVKYSTPYKDGIQSYAHRETFDFAVQKKFLKNKLNAVAGVYDIFHGDYSPLTSNLPGQYYYSSIRTDSRRGFVSLIYRFGNMRITRKHDDSQDEETKRIKKEN